MKIKKLFIIVLSFLFFVNACTSLQENMAGSKRSNKSDEFLVYKKKPLVLPPDYDELPKPRAEDLKNKKTSKKSDTLKDLLNVYNDNENKNSKSNEDVSLENSILEKIKNN